MRAGANWKMVCVSALAGRRAGHHLHSQSISGGYVPVGAVITKPRIMDCVFDSMERCVVHSNTFGQNDMAMAAALASLYVIEEDKLVENAAKMGEYAMTRA